MSINFFLSRMKNTLQHKYVCKTTVQPFPGRVIVPTVLGTEDENYIQKS